MQTRDGRGQTCAEVDDDVEEKESVGDDIEGDPSQRVDLLAEEGDGHGQDDHVGDQQNQHDQIPVEPATIDVRRLKGERDEPEGGAGMDDAVSRPLLSESFLDQSFPRAEQFHRQFVVRRFEQVHQVVDDVRGVPHRGVEEIALLVANGDLLGGIDVLGVERMVEEDLLGKACRRRRIGFSFRGEIIVLRLDRHRDRRVGGQDEFFFLHLFVVEEGERGWTTHRRLLRPDRVGQLHSSPHLSAVSLVLVFFQNVDRLTRLRACRPSLPRLPFLSLRVLLVLLVGVLCRRRRRRRWSVEREGREGFLRVGAFPFDLIERGEGTNGSVVGETPLDTRLHSFLLLARLRLRLRSFLLFRLRVGLFHRSAERRRGYTTGKPARFTCQHLQRRKGKDLLRIKDERCVTAARQRVSPSVRPLAEENTRRIE